MSGTNAVCRMKAVLGSTKTAKRWLTSDTWLHSGAQRNKLYKREQNEKSGGERLEDVFKIVGLTFQ